MFNEKEYQRKYRLKNKEKKKEFNNRYYLINKDKINKYRKKCYKENKNNIKEKKYIYNKNFCIKNIAKVKKYQKDYREKNNIKLEKQNRKYRFKNRNKINERMKQYYKKIAKEARLRSLKSWEGYIPKETKCQICSKKIYFNQSNNKEAIHFDHKNENALIEKNPTSWLYQHPRNPENQKIWESCKFGMLCKGCNNFLPTKNRKKFIVNVTKYIFPAGKNI